ncbi:paired amphipathic helix protein Sin3a-like isoform X2 [Watersipora subatra]|uniref:paired amphipathic helix protein Sin3a-like isoform X2 n=1 Tax=Watersipora subatra TaxID=2589382 RepID=UPI00355C5963
MQAPDPNNPNGFLLSTTVGQQPINPIAPIVPRPGIPLNQTGAPFPQFSTRPVFTQDTQSVVHRSTVPLAIPSITTNITMSNLSTINSSLSASAGPPFNQLPQVHNSAQVKPVLAAAIPQPVQMLNQSASNTPISLTTQPVSVQPSPVSTSVMQTISGISVASATPPTVPSQVTVGGPVQPMLVPPHHQTGPISTYPQAPTLANFPTPGSSPHMTTPIAPLSHLGATHRPIQAVQPQMPIVQSVIAGAVGAIGHHPGGQAQQFQRLKVEDALSYLDQVKLQFGNHPQVYNDFLDIMKEFKSQSIDTPGVISRVSNLFKGHPELIVGFNTFLPPGYKIEVQANDTISVQQPGQPSMSLSQLTGTATNRDHSHLSAHQPYRAKPVNLQGTPSTASASSAHPDMPRSGLDNVVAAATATDAISSTPGQPVEFNHAINYVNKIKNRFQGQPEIYKNFLEILHKYQKEQKLIKDGTVAASGTPLTETEVYSKVAKLFQNQEDLLKEFGQFLPDANGQGGFFGKSGLFGEPRDLSTSNKPRPFSMATKRDLHTSKLSSSSSMRKYGNSGSAGMPPSKKSKLSGSGGNKDLSLGESAKYGSLSEYAIFDKVRKLMRSQEVYDNFLRCLVLFNQEVISRSELIQLVQPFLGRFPEVYRKFKDLVGFKDGGPIMEAVASGAFAGQAKAERMMRDDLSMEIDYSSCKRYGHSYRGLPKTYHPPRCTGRTSLCREVLNDTWVSFPSWSEESTFVTSRKTTFEENIYRCEDERFELDMVIETNQATLRVLEGVQKRLQKMSTDDAAKFKLDNTLGGFSEVVHVKAIQRIYGEKAPDVIEGLKKNPVVVVPMVLRRLKSKDDEWKEAQRQFNKIWAEQNEKYYLKSLDHQGIHFKQADTKSLRSKSLLNEIEAIYDAEQNYRKQTETEAADETPTLAPTGDDALKKPHLTFTYKNPTLVDDALSLIIHHARRQASIQKEDKQLIKQLIKQNVQRFFFRTAAPLSDDEDDDEVSEEDKEDSKPPSPITTSVAEATKARRSSSRVKIAAAAAAKEAEDKKAQAKMTSVEQDFDEKSDGIERYSLFYANSNWYLFLRLHQILCHRLHQIKLVCDTLVADARACKKDKSESVAVALRLRLPSEVDPEQYYSVFLDLVMSLLDGNIESNQYEDQLREIFGIHAYITFTLDKVIQNIVKQLQYIVTDELCRDVTDNWMKETSNDATGGEIASREERAIAEGVYRKRMETLLSDDNCFEITMYTKDNVLAFTLLDTDSESSIGSAVAKSERWNDYVDKYVPGELDPDLDSNVKEHLKRKPIFLKRNIDKWKQSSERQKEHNTKEKLAPSSSKVQEEQTSKNLTTETDMGNKSVVKDSDDPADTPSKSDANEKVDINGSEEIDLPEGMRVKEGEACRFSLGSFKMVKVVRSEDYLYRNGALNRAAKSHKHVSQNMFKLWDKFCTIWRERNTNAVESEKVTRWLNGDQLEDCRSCRTICRKDNDVQRAPYRPYSRYSVRYERVTAAVTSSIDDGSLTALSTASDDMDAL